MTKRGFGLINSTIVPMVKGTVTFEDFSCQSWKLCFSRTIFIIISIKKMQKSHGSYLVVELSMDYSGIKSRMAQLTSPLVHLFYS